MFAMLPSFSGSAHFVWLNGFLFLSLLHISVEFREITKIETRATKLESAVTKFVQNWGDRRMHLSFVLRLFTVKNLKIGALKMIIIIVIKMEQVF